MPRYRRCNTPIKRYDKGNYVQRPAQKCEKCVRETCLIRCTRHYQDITQANIKKDSINEN